MPTRIRSQPVGYPITPRIEMREMPDGPAGLVLVAQGPGMNPVYQVLEVPRIEIHPLVDFYGPLSLVDQFPTDGTVHTSHWHPDGDRIAVGFEGAILYILEFDKASGSLAEIASLDLGVSTIYACKWNYSGDRIAVGSVWSPTESVHVLAFDKDTGALSKIAGLTVPEWGVNDCAWNPDGDRIAVACNQWAVGTPLRVYAFDKAAGTLVEVTSYAFEGDVLGCDWNAEGDRIAVAHHGGHRFRVLSFNKATGTLAQVATYDIGATGWACAWHPDGDRIAVAGGTDKLYILSFDKRAGTLGLVATFNTGPGTPYDCAWNATGDMVAVAHEGEGSPPWGEVLHVLRFDKAAGTLTEVASHDQVDDMYTGHSCAWNIDGDRVSFGQSAPVNRYLDVFKGDGTIITPNKASLLTIEGRQYRV